MNKKKSISEEKCLQKACIGIIMFTRSDFDKQPFSWVISLWMRGKLLKKTSMDIVLMYLLLLWTDVSWGNRGFYWYVVTERFCENIGRAWEGMGGHLPHLTIFFKTPTPHQNQCLPMGHPPLKNQAPPIWKTTPPIETWNTLPWNDS